MRNTFISFLLLLSAFGTAQEKMMNLGSGFNEKQKYISLNFFSIGEPQLAIGPSFGMRFTQRSEVFAELAYVGKTPFYKNDWANYSFLHGARFIAQYRYHFLQQWRPLINVGQANRRMRARHEPFMGVEFRVKPVSFGTNADFVNSNTNDTLSANPFKASAFTYGGAFILGNTFNLSRDEKWKLEFSIGLGAKQRVVTIKDAPAGYKLIKFESRAIHVPKLYEDFGTVLIPCALRLRYVID